MVLLGGTSLGMLLFFAAVGRVKSECTAMFNEINPGSPDHEGKANEETEEFIELKSTCAGQQISLHNWTIAVWKSAKGKDEAKVVLKLSLNLTGIPRDNGFFVMAGPNLAGELRKLDNKNLDVRSFTDQNITEWKNRYPAKTTDFMDNGSERLIALVLYKNLAWNELPLNTLLSEKTAYVNKIEDVVFYHRTGRISQPMIRYLMPGYSLNKVDLQEAAVLKDFDKKGTLTEPVEDRSLSYCCSKNQTKWPLAFQHVRATPGADNACESGTSKTFVITKGAGNLDMKQRCDKDFVKNFSPPDPKPKQAKKVSAAEESTKVKAPGKVSKVVSSLREGVKGEAAHLIDAGKSVMEESIEQTTKQVTLLASIVGTIVIVLGLLILGGSYLYVRRRKLQPAQRTRARHGYNRPPVSVADSETDFESVLDREDLLARARVP